MNGVNQEMHELIQADIDGLISDTDRIRLLAHLKHDDQARELHEDYRRLGDSLESLPELDSPVDFAAAVMAVDRPPRQEEVAEPRPSVFTIWFEFPVLRYALAFLVGAIFASGISQFRMADERGSDVAGLAGAMSSMNQFHFRQSFELEQTELDGQIDLLRSDKLLQLRFDLDSKLPIEVIVTYAGQTYHFSGFLQDSNIVSSLNAGDGQVALVANGKQRFTVQLSTAAADKSPITVSFISDGEEIDTLTISSYAEESP